MFMKSFKKSRSTLLYDGTYSTYSHIITRMNGSSTGRDLFENKTALPHTNGLQPTLSLYKGSVRLKGCD